MTFLSTHLSQSSRESLWGDCYSFLGRSGCTVEPWAASPGELLGPPHALPSFSHLQMSPFHGQAGGKYERMDPK